MQSAVHPRLSVGVALVGAGLIAASTVAPVVGTHLPSVDVSVDLAAAVNPFEAYSHLVQDAIGNTSALVENARPFELLQRIALNRLAGGSELADAIASNDLGEALTTAQELVQTAVDELAAGNVAGATDALVQIPLVVGLPLTQLLPTLQHLITQPLTNLVKVIDAFDPSSLETQLLLGGLVAPLISAPAAAGVAVQNIIDAAGSGEAGQIVAALLAVPAVVVDGLLNGGYGPDLGPLVGSAGIPVKAGGLLSSAGLLTDANGDFFVNTGGPLAAVQQIVNTITTAITPPDAAESRDAAAIPAADAPTVTLSTTPSRAALVAENPAQDTIVGRPDASKPAPSTPAAAKPAVGLAPATSENGASGGSGSTASDEVEGAKAPSVSRDRATRHVSKTDRDAHPRGGAAGGDSAGAGSRGTAAS